MIELGRLEGFYWVAKLRGYTRAARAFSYPISQPGVHQQVKKLEAQIGVELFERVAKDEVRLTAAGERLYAFCAPFLEQLPAVVDAIKSATFEGVLRIDASGLVLRQLLPRWARELRRRHPAIQIDLREIEVPDFDRLRKGSAHLVVDHIAQVPDACAAVRVATSYAFLILPAAHPAARKRSVDLANLRGEPFVSYHPDLPQHALQMEAVRRRIGVPARTLSASSVDSILAFVQAGLGFSVVPWLDRRGPALPGVSVRRQRGPGTEFPIRAVHWHTSPPHPLVEAALAAAPK
jgi:DNA-binding transcriptional LysR family regulator